MTSVAASSARCVAHNDPPASLWIMWSRTILAGAVAISLVRCALLTDEERPADRGTLADASDESIRAMDASASVPCDPKTRSYCPTGCFADLGNPDCYQGEWHCSTQQSDWECRGAPPPCPNDAAANCVCNGIGSNNDPFRRMIWLCGDAGARPSDASAPSDAFADADALAD